MRNGSRNAARAHHGERRWAHFSIRNPREIGVIAKAIGARRPVLSVQLILCSLFSAGVILSSCGTGSTEVNSDSAGDSLRDTATTTAMTVTEPVSPVPKIEADSIWNGDYVKKYPNGLVEKRGYISGGLASGEWLTFYEDGKPWSKGYYHNGVRTGYGVSWHHNGQKSSEGYYNNGSPVGVWSYWSESTHQLQVKDWGGVMPDTSGAR